MGAFRRQLTWYEWIGIAICLLGLALSLSLLGCAPAKQPDPPKSVEVAPKKASGPDSHYCLQIGKLDRPEQFSNDTVPLFGEFNRYGEVVVHINNTPACIFGVGTRVYRITEWLQDGANRIHVTGTFKESFYVKVLRVGTPGGEFPLTTDIQEVLAKQIYTPDGDRPALEFSVAIEHPSLFEPVAETPDEIETRQVELQGMVDSLFAAVREHDGKAFATLLPGRRQLPWESAEDQNETVQEDSEHREEIASVIADSDVELVTKPEDIKIVVGSKSAAIYSGVNDTNHAFLFELTRDDETAEYDAMILRLQGGKWVINY